MPARSNCANHVANLEFFVAAAGKTKKRNAVVVGETRLARLGDLRDFDIGDVQTSKGLNGSEAHSGIIERGCVEGL